MIIILSLHNTDSESISITAQLIKLPFMEKSQTEKFSSFSFMRIGSKSSDNEAGEDPLPHLSLDEVLREVDQFVDLLTYTADKRNPPEPPMAAMALPPKVLAVIAKYDGAGATTPEDDSSLVEAVKRLAALNDRFGEFMSHKSACSTRTNAVLQKSMSFFEKRMRSLLEDYKGNIVLKSKSKNSSFRKPDKDADPPDPSNCLDGFPGFSDSTVSKIREIASLMISAGYESECCLTHHVSRRKALKLVTNRLGFDNISVDDVQRMSWDGLEGQIASWIQLIKGCAAVIFPRERQLCESIFSDHPEVYRREYTHLTVSMTTRLLNFADAVAATKRSTEKLFKFLDMYETFRDTMPALEDSNPTNTDLAGEISAVMNHIAEAVVAIFSDLENSIKNDAGKTPVPSGAVHPSTRYTMNYLKYACEYKDTLEQVFTHNNNDDAAEAASTAPNDDGTAKTSPFAVQLIRVMELLDENLEMKSNLYKDASLRFVFLMNNGRYIVQKIKGSPEIHELVGDNFYRTRSSTVRKHHKSYQRETWGKLLQSLRHEGLQVSGGKLTNKPVLKERLKGFNNMLEDIHKTQSTWVVSDEQLQWELRAAVAGLVIPAYRSFLGRFQQFLHPGKQMEKYVKYQPEDIEDLIEGLFDGNPSSFSRKNTLGRRRIMN